MIETKLAMTLAVLIVACITFTGCSVHMGIDYQGQTHKSDTTESPNFRQKATRLND